MFKLNFQRWLESVELEGNIRLYHGTDKESAEDILRNGLNSSRSSEFNSSGEFWASPSDKYAYWFAKTNPRELEEIAIVSFEIPKSVFSLILKNPRLVTRHSHMELEFLPKSFDILNKNMQSPKIDTPQE